MATKVKLRRKPISGNRQSLFLDFWPPVKHPETGKSTRREFLNLFLYSDTEFERETYRDSKGKEQIRYVPALNRSGNPRKIKLSSVEEQHNSEVQLLAEGILLKWMTELTKPEIYSGYEQEQIRLKGLGQRDFLTYFEQLGSKRSGSAADSWKVTLIYLKQFAGDTLKVEDLTERFCSEFRDYVNTTTGIIKDKKRLSQNSASVYFSKFRAALRDGYKDGVIPIDLAPKVKAISQVETQKNFLTIQELNKLVKTDCPTPVLKKAALFSALTGLRFSDIVKLQWDEVEEIDGKHHIHFRQKKTGKVEYMPISEQAFNLLPEKTSQRVFYGLTYSSHYNKHLFQWLGAAGITKDITFHSFRHTYAVLQLDRGTDIYTVSKMLGHRNLSTTQIYAKLLDKAKRDTLDKIHLDM